MKKITIYLFVFTLLISSEISQSQEWTPVFNFNSVNGRIATSKGDKVFTYQPYNFMNESYEAMLSLDNGSTWTQVHDDKFATAFFNSQEDLYAIRQDNFPGTYLYFPQSIFLTTDNGNNWTTIDIVADNMGQVNASAFRMDNSGTLYTAFRDFSAGTGGFKYSTDDGVSWTLIPTFISGPYDYTDIYSALLTSNGDFFITTYNQGVFKSTDAGENWTKVYNTFITLGFLNQHPLSGDLYVASFGAVLKSTDNGENWEELIPDPWMAMNIIEFEITDDGTFWFANAGGIYKSDDAVHWEQIWDVEGKSPQTIVNVMNMSISDNYIYVSASDSTVYRKLREGSVGINFFEENNSLNIYPNPAQDYITVKFDNADNNIIEHNLRITDISGRLVYNAVLPYGSRSNKVNIANLETGYYVVTLVSGTRSISQKLIISK